MQPDPDAYPPTEERECEKCGKTKEIPANRDFCNPCANSIAMSQRSRVDGEWPKYSDMDQL